MNLVSAAFFCLLALLILEILVRKADFFSPIRLYLLSHSAAAGVAFLALDPAMTPFRPFTWLVYLGSGLSFVLGTWLVRLLLKDSVESNAPLKPLQAMPYNWKLHFGFSTALFLFFVWGLLGAYRAAGEFPLFAESSAKSFHSFADHGLYTFGFNFAGVVMALFFMTIFRPSRLPKILNVGFWATAGTFAVFLLVLSRVSLLFFVFFAMVFYHHGIRRIAFWKLAGIFVLGFSLIVVTGYFKTSSTRQRLSISFSKTVDVAMKIPYFYIANNFWNLDHALNLENSRESHPRTYGFTSLQGFIDLIPAGGGMLGGQIRQDTHIDNQFNKSSIKIHGWNTFLYQWILYKDFGLAGVLAAPFFIGSAIGVLYLKVRRRPSVLNLAVYSFVAFFIYNSLFGFMTEAPNYAYGFVYLCLCCYLSQTLLPKTRSVQGAVSGPEAPEPA